MSSWRIVIRDLYAAGGGPLHPRRFDCGELEPCSLYYGLGQARKLGLVVNTVDGRGDPTKSRWALTQQGIDLCEGRVAIEYPRTGQSGQAGRKAGSGMRPVATWLMALPRAGEIRLGNT